MHTCIHRPTHTHILTNANTVYTLQLRNFVGTASPQCVYLCFTAASKFDFVDLWEKNRQVYACMMHECMCEVGYLKAASVVDL